MFWFAAAMFVVEIVTVIKTVSGCTSLSGDSRVAGIVVTALLVIMSVDTCRRMRRKIRPLRAKLAAEDMLRH